MKPITINEKIKLVSKRLGLLNKNNYKVGRMVGSRISGWSRFSGSIEVTELYITSLSKPVLPKSV